jgi:hypothetical protein
MAEGMPRRTSSVSKSGIAMSNIAVSAAATPASAQILNRAFCAAYARVAAPAARSAVAARSVPALSPVQPD